MAAPLDEALRTVMDAVQETRAREKQAIQQLEDHRQRASALEQQLEQERRRAAELEQQLQAAQAAAAKIAAPPAMPAANGGALEGACISPGPCEPISEHPEEDGAKNAGPQGPFTSAVPRRDPRLMRAVSDLGVGGATATPWAAAGPLAPAAAAAGGAAPQGGATAAAPSSIATTRADGVGGSGPRSPAALTSSRSGPVAGATAMRRHTAPALTAGTGLYEHLSSTAARLAELRQELELARQQKQAAAAACALRSPGSAAAPSLLQPVTQVQKALEAVDGAQAQVQAQQAQQAQQQQQQSDGMITLERLEQMLATCLQLQENTVRTVTGQLARQDSMSEQAEVSLADDGSAGVGATAAAAVSVALAQSWAAAAGSHPAQTAAVAQGCVRPGKASFKLVAAVPRNHRRQAPASSDSSRGRMPKSLQEGRRSPFGTSPPGSRANLLTAGGSPSGSRANLLGDGSTVGLDTMSDAAPESLDESQEATWRASGCHLKLQWLSPPSAVLVVHKPVPSVTRNCVDAICWLLRSGITVYVEPAQHASLTTLVAQQLRQQQEEEEAKEQQQRDGQEGQGHWEETSQQDVLHSRGSSDGTATTTSGGNGGGNGSSNVGGNGGSGRQGSGGVPNGQHCQNGGSSPALLAPEEVDLESSLQTWPEQTCSACPEELPRCVAEGLDLVITLGGDGTVLWTCSLFGNGAVPPIVPFAMGSLGFMTPFPISCMEAVLSRVTSVGQGLPLMLRHRLHCRILRDPEASSADLARLECQEEHLVLNEVVIDRGMTASLTNLQCYADHNHVTVIQGDGLIVATPTGSTAYNLAAGGSMIHPGVPGILFTPICPHTLSSRPLVFPEHVALRVKVPLNSRSEAYCSFDGKNRQALHRGDSVLMQMSRWPVPMVCSLDASHDWFLAVREGLHWNQRKVQQGPVPPQK